MPSGGQNWKSTRHDKYYTLAKEQGYRSRAAFKLIQINKKYKLIEKCNSILDLCCAPGGWLQVCHKLATPQCNIVGIDLLPVKPIHGCTIMQYDITSVQCEVALKKHYKQYKLDLCVHDGAPNVSGGFSFSRDIYVQNELVLKSLQLASKFLAKNGSFITKVFRSNEYNNLIYIFNQLFTSVEINKPLASRSTSAEIFVVCKGFLAPKSIDEKLFQPKYVFQYIDTTTQRNNNVFSAKLNMKQRNRAGYADNTKQLIESKISILQYIDAVSTEKAIDLLGTSTELVFNSTDATEQSLIDTYKSHVATTDEIITLCSDLRVIGKGDFKQLLKWRKQILQFKKQLMEQSKANNTDSTDITVDTTVTDTPVQTEADTDAQLDSEIAELNAILSKNERKALKKKKLLRNKQHKKMLINLHNANLEGDTNDVTYFSVNSIVGKNALDTVIDNDDNVQNIDSDNDMQQTDDTDSNSDSDESTGEYYNKLEAQLDDYYNTYRDTKTKTMRDNNKLQEQADTADHSVFEQHHMHNSTDDEISDNIHSDVDEIAPLNVEFTKRLSANETTKRWFERDIFATMKDVNERSERPKTTKTLIQVSDSDSESESVHSDSSVDDRYGEPQNTQPQTAKQIAESNGHIYGTAAITGGTTDDNDFEVVPTQDANYTSDEDAVAERLALGQHMLRKRSREALVDSAYNRYTYNDNSDLPDWFIDNENEHNKPALPITAAQVSAVKAKLIAINARPIKKIAEAKARKKIRAVRRWEKVKTQSENIMNSVELNSSQKIKQIEQMMIKQHKKKKSKHAEKQYVVAKKGGGTAASGVRAKKGARIVKVDRKMKKDRRGLKNAEKRNAAKSKGRKRQKT